MLKSRLLGSVICVYLALSAGASPSQAANCEDTIARHMVGEAMLAAQFVAAAKKRNDAGGDQCGSQGHRRQIRDR
jgi:hypothetical protein